MSEDKPDQNQSPSPAPPAVAASAPPSVQDKIKNGKTQPPRAKLGWGARLVLLLALLLAVAAAGVAGYLFYMNQQRAVAAAEQRESITQTLADRAQRVERMASEINRLQQQLNQTRDALKSVNRNRDQLQSRLAALENEISAISGAHRIDWMLREVEHFITVAEQRLSLLGDARGALALLQEAEDIVRAMNEPAARPLREALVDDIHDLKLAAETSVDVEGIFLRLADLADRVVKLGIPRFELKQEPVESEAGEPMPEEGLDLFWYRFKNFVTSLYDYQKHPKGRPITLTEDREFLARNVILLLQQAQLALLRGDNEAYRVSLMGARDRVEMYIHQQTGETQFFVSEISDLLSVQLQPPLPTITDSLRAVRVFREYWRKEKLVREQQLESIQQTQSRRQESGSGSATAEESAP